jgi:hypothetical protein
MATTHRCSRRRPPQELFEDLIPFIEVWRNDLHLLAQLLFI